MAFEKVTVSLPPELLPRIEAVRAGLAADLGIRVTTSGVFASLLRAALDNAERDTAALAARQGRRRRA